MTKTKTLATGMLLSALVLTTSSFAYAIEATTLPIRERNETMKATNQEFRTEVKDAIKTATKPGEMRGTVRELNQERMASNSATRQLYRSERAQNHGERIERRFAFYAQRLTNIATRIQSRIDTEKAAGKDTTAAQSALDKAKTLLTQAVADGKQAVTMFQSISVAVWSTQAPEIKAAIEQANKARTGFVQARLSLIDATTSL